MSSEMRELIAKWRETADQCEERGLEACSIGLTVAANKADARADELRGCANELEALLARTEAGAVEKRAPVQRYHGKTIPWRVHGLAWEAYAKKYGSSQSAERIAERGGFGVGEMDEFLPGWREMAEGTHPQDASGDAREAERYRWLRDEASRAQLEMFADRRGTRLAADRVCDAGIDISAMQAKEAK